MIIIRINLRNKKKCGLLLRYVILKEEKHKKLHGKHFLKFFVNSNFLKLEILKKMYLFTFLTHVFIYFIRSFSLF